MKKIKCILLIDDNPADNTFHKINIAEADVCDYVAVATNGREALSYLMKSGEPDSSSDSASFPKPDIIFLDINMPGMNGFEFLDEYEKLDEKIKSSIVIIMLSTSLNPEDEKRAMSYKEVAEFQYKPLTAELFAETVKKYFNNGK